MSVCASMSEVWVNRIAMRYATAFRVTASDISFLKGFPLKRLLTNKSSFKDLSPQSESILVEVSISWNKKSKKLWEKQKRLKMYKLLQEINPVLFGKNDQEPSIEKSGRLVEEPPIDNFVFRLHYRATTAGLIAASILVIISNSFNNPSYNIFCRQAVIITWTVVEARFSVWLEKGTARLSHR